MKNHTIGEVSKLIDVNTHVVRYWVDNLKHIEPLIGKGDRRYFRENEIEELKKVKTLIHEFGMSLEGVKHLVHYNKIKMPNMNNKKEENVFSMLELDKKIKNIEIRIDDILKILEI